MWLVKAELDKHSLYQFKIVTFNATEDEHLFQSRLTVRAASRSQEMSTEMREENLETGKDKKSILIAV